MAEVARHPIRRTTFYRCLFAWIALVIGVTLLSFRLAEGATDLALVIGLFVIYVAPTPVLLAWGVWVAWRGSARDWAAPVLLVAFCGMFLVLSEPLVSAGRALNFAARRPAYDRIVADVQSGRYRGRPDARGWVEGRRGDIRFSFNVARPELIQFAWSYNSGISVREVIYSPGCPPPPRAAPAPGEPEMKSIPNHHLGGHYCYFEGII